MANSRKRKTIRKYKDRSINQKSPYTDIYNKPISDAHKLGYCHNKIHIGYLNHKMIIEHGCTKNNCPYFHKYEDHQFWIDKQNRKGKKSDA
jgi:hypothetical protein